MNRFHTVATRSQAASRQVIVFSSSQTEEKSANWRNTNQKIATTTTMEMTTPRIFLTFGSIHPFFAGAVPVSAVLTSSEDSAARPR